MVNSKTTRIKVALAVLILMALVFAGVKLHQKQSEKYVPITYRPALFPKAIVAPSNATNKSYHSPEFTKAMPLGRYSMSYFVNESYPAESTRAFIKETLESQGWQKLKYSLYVPKRLAKTSWTVKEKWEEAPERIYFQEHWFNPAEDMVTVILVYNILDDSGVKEDVVHVNVGFASNSTGIHKTVVTYKQMHPDEFAEKK